MVEAIPPMPSTPNPHMDAALDYASRGWKVFPVYTWTGSACACGNAECSSPAKHPMVSEWQKRATSDEMQIRAWWRTWPNANIGLACGEASGVWVLDIDDYPKARAFIESRGGGVDTALSQTGGGGYHAFMQWPGWRVRNRVQVFAGADIRGDGGYVVMPPSVHASGLAYQWVHRGEVSAAPAWLLELVATPDKVEPVVNIADMQRVGGGSTPYGRRALENEIAELRATTGESHKRNVTLNNAALKLGSLVAARHLEEGEVKRELFAAALSIGLGPKEAGATIESGFRAGLARPRIVPENEAAMLVFPQSPGPDLLKGIGTIGTLNGAAETGETPPSPPVYPVVKIWEVDEPPPRTWVLGGFIPDGAITALFGDGGMGKSYIALYIATLSCLGASFGDARVARRTALYIDAELDDTEFARRAYPVARGLGLERPPVGLHYLSLPGSVVDRTVIDTVANTIRHNGVGFSVLDSLSIASAGGDPTAAKDMIPTLQRLRTWGTVITIDHITKPQAGANMSHHSQFGTVFKRNIARSSIRLVQAAAGGVSLQPDKSNFGPKPDPVYLDMKFDGNAVRFRHVDINDPSMAGIVEHLPAIERVYEAMAAEEEQQSTVLYLSQTLGMSEKTVKNHLSVLRQRGRVDSDNNGLWRVVHGCTLTLE